MSLHDVDKNNEDRSVPKPNQSDQLIDGARQNHGTNSANYISDATTLSTNTPVRTGFKRQVKSFITLITWSGANTTTTSTIPHGLPYTPTVDASINNATLTGAVSLTNVSIALPTVIDWDTSTTPLSIKTFMWFMADATNIYVITANGNNGSANSLFVTFYLSEQRFQS